MNATQSIGRNNAATSAGGVGGMMGFEDWAVLESVGLPGADADGFFDAGFFGDWLLIEYQVL